MFILLIRLFCIYYTALILFFPLFQEKISSKLEKNKKKFVKIF